MRKLVLATFAAAALVASGASAFAAEQTDGTVASVNVQSGTLTLQSGETFNFRNGVVLSGLMPGQSVGVTHNGAEGIGAFDNNPAGSDSVNAY